MSNGTYKYQVSYGKRFTSGLLEGCLYDDFLKFTDWNTADDFRKLCESGHEFVPFAGSNYKAEYSILEAI